MPGPREWWMVQYRLNADSPMRFEFCETRDDAIRREKHYRTLGYYASHWQL